MGEERVRDLSCVRRAFNFVVAARLMMLEEKYEVLVG